MLLRSISISPFIVLNLLILLCFLKNLAKLVASRFVPFIKIFLLALIRKLLLFVITFNFFNFKNLFLLITKSLISIKLFPSSKPALLIFTMSSFFSKSKVIFVNKLLDFS